MAAASWPCPIADTRVSVRGDAHSVVDTVTHGGETVVGADITLWMDMGNGLAGCPSRVHPYKA